MVGSDQVGKSGNERQVSVTNDWPVGAAEGCDGGVSDSAFAAFGSSYKKCISLKDEI
jgi:hypothetical protein